ncbi:hypothetical protein LTR85_002477 [Meristemomyces frigidus]|nr:hypothetical protein LTR85_002477 [Meristemomyces frigidus]
MSAVFEALGAELFEACVQDNADRVKTLTSKPIIINWTMVLIAAAEWRARGIASYCMTQTNRLDLADGVLRWVACNEDSDQVCRFLVDSDFVTVDHPIDRWGTTLGIVAATGKANRHSLVAYLLEKGADPNRTLEMQGHMRILTCAAGYSDAEMVGLLLDHGAHLSGSGALVFAAEKGKMQTVKLLIARGADVNEKGVATYIRRSLLSLGSPLHKAVENGHVAVVDVLLQAGADLAVTDAKGRTAADIAAAKGMHADILSKLGRPS